MTYDWQTQLRPSDQIAVASVPPVTIEETAWDILLALHSDRHCDLTLQKLASVVSIPEAAMNRWLPKLEQCELITAAEHRSTGEILAVLTRRGRELLDRYFSAAGDLRVAPHH